MKNITLLLLFLAAAATIIYKVRIPYAVTFIARIPSVVGGYLSQNAQSRIIHHSLGPAECSDAFYVSSITLKSVPKLWRDKEKS